jgi:hypothetical protein
MKVILPLQGTVALHVSADEVAPERGLALRDLMDYVKKTYQFGIAPQFPVNFPPALMQNVLFQSGMLITENSRSPIIQLAMVPNGDMVTAQTTDVADKILDDLIQRLDADLGYRYSSATKKERFYQSDIVVQFDSSVDDRIEGIKKIEEILSREIKLPGFFPSLKRLGFGQGDVTQGVSFELVGKSDFLIERRSGADYSQNRYACSAPLTTAEHVRVLEVLERELG